MFSSAFFAFILPYFALFVNSLNTASKTRAIARGILPLLDNVGFGVYIPVLPEETELTSGLKTWFLRRQEVLSHERILFDASISWSPWSPNLKDWSGTKDEQPDKNHEKIDISSVQFTAVCQEEVKQDNYAEIDIYASTEEEKEKIAAIIEKEFRKGGYKTKESSFYDVEVGATLKIFLCSDDISIEDDTEEMKWRGKYGKVSFQVHVPGNYSKKQIAFRAKVFCDEIPICKLAFTVNIQKEGREYAVESTRFEKAFVSYANPDRDKVYARLQGMKHRAPYLDIFMDVISLRSGEDWEHRLMEEISLADIFYLFWSHSALQSEWVEKEWKYAYSEKGLDFIEPIPLEPPSIAPVPKELQSKHFNDLLLMLGKE